MNPTRTTLVEYRDISQDIELIEIDEADFITGLQGFGVKPVRVQTDGKKLAYAFVKEEALAPFQSMQRALAGMVPGPLLIDYVEELKARHAFKGNLTMMRTVKIFASS